MHECWRRKCCTLHLLHSLQASCILKASKNNEMYSYEYDDHVTLHFAAITLKPDTENSRTFEKGEQQPHVQ